MKSKNISIFFIIISVIFLIILILSVTISKQNKNNFTAILYNVKPAPLHKFISGAGIIRPYYKYILRAKYKSKVLEVYANEGTHIKKNALLAVLASRQAQNNFEDAKDNFSQIIIQKERAKNNLAQTKILVDGGALPAQNLETARNNFLQVNLKYKNAKNNFLHLIYYKTMPTDTDILRNTNPFKLSSLYIRSPISGTVVSLPISSGDILIGGSAIATIMNLQKLKLKLYIDEQDINFVKKGQLVFIKSPVYQNIIFNGIVRTVSFQPTSGSLFEIVIDITNTQGIDVKPGISARAKILYAQKDSAIIIPTIGIINKNNHNFVFTFNRHRSKLQKIETGYSNSDFTEVISGLKTNDTIIVGNYKLLKYLITNHSLRGKGKISFVTYSNE